MRASPWILAISEHQNKTLHRLSPESDGNDWRRRADEKTHALAQDGAAVLYVCLTRQLQRQNLHDVSRLMDTADRQKRI